MKKITLLLLLSSSLLAQPWYYNFGTSTGSHTSGVSETFLPATQTNGGVARVRVGIQGGSFNLENQTISFGSESYLRGVAPTGGSVNKFSIYNYTAGKAFTIQFIIRMGDSDGSAAGASSGTWYFFAGDGAMYSDNNTFTGTQVFTGIRWQFGSSGSITTNVRVGGSWTGTGITGTPFSQGNTYTVDIYGNNTAVLTNYTYGTSQSVAANTMDIWVNGVLVADDIGKALLANDSDIDSWLFYGESSMDNVANIFLDDIYYLNAISDTALPVELSSFTAKVLKSGGIQLNWRTETEVNNYGFEIQRAESNFEFRNSNFEMIGFVQGHGNSNSPKDYSFIDKNVSGGKYVYRLKQIDTDGSFEYSKVIEVDAESIPDEIVLEQNYPNPFNPSTNIGFRISEREFVRLKVYDVLGEEIATLVNEELEAGKYEVVFNAAQSPLGDRPEITSGVYFYQLATENKVENRKMLLVK